MHNKLIVASAALLAAPALTRGRSLGRHRTCDTAFTFRMGAGFAGDVNRGHPASILPCLIDPTNPVTLFGIPVIVVTTSNGVRPFAAGDTALVDAFGVSVRPFPYQQATTANNYGAVAYGAGAPSTLQPLDVLRAGYIMVPVVGTVTKGGAVFVWCAAASGAHVQGGFEAAASGGNTAALATPKFMWNSPADSTGIAELSITL